MVSRLKDGHVESWSLARVVGSPLDPARLRRDHGRHVVAFHNKNNTLDALMSVSRAHELQALAPADHLEGLRGVSRPFEGSGGSFRVLRAQALDDTLRAFALDLLAELGEEINVNLSLSPAGEPGLG